MKSLFLLAMVWLTTFAADFSKNSIVSIDELAELKWKKRVVLVFNFVANSKEGAELEKSISNTNSQEIKDRDIAIFRVSREAKELSKKFNVSNEHLTTILIGKDGYEKTRRLGGFSIREFFPIVDAMPMRVRELRDKANIN